MSMFTAHKKYQRPSEVGLTASERVDFDFIIACETSEDPDFVAPYLELDWDDDLVYIQRFCAYMERWEVIHHKYAELGASYPKVPDSTYVFELDWDDEYDDRYEYDDEDWEDW